MPASRILIVATDLFLVSRAHAAAAACGCEARQVMTLERLGEEISRGAASLALVDLEADAALWEGAVAVLLALGESRPAIIGYAGHVRAELLERGLALGCDRTLTKGQLSRDMGKIIAEASDIPAPPRRLGNL